MKKLIKPGFWVIFAAFVVLVLVLGVGGLIFESKYKDRFYPGVVIGGEAVGGKTYDEVTHSVKNHVNNLTRDGLEVELKTSEGVKTFIVPVSRTGLTPDTLVDYFVFRDPQEVIDQAYRWGRTGSAARKFAERFSLVTRKEFKFDVVVYDEAIKSLVEQELVGVLKKTVPAHFVWRDGEIDIEKEQIGEIVDVASGVELIGQRLVILNDDAVTISATQDVPPTTAKSLEPFKSLAEGLAKSTTLVFSYNGYKWRVPGSTLVEWLVIKSGGEVALDPARLEKFLNETAVLAIENPPQNSRFEMRQGELVETVPGHAGKMVDVAKTIENVEQVIYDSEGVVNVPVVIIDAEPRVTKETIERYAIKDLVGSARTSFKGSSNDRRKNITVGASKLNGLLIAPGEEFSLVNGIGYVTEEEGYAKEFVIKDGQSIKELGGGLCQIATTVFRAVLNAGLPVTERQNHRYVVGYYGPGLDATIYGPHPDLRFINDTGNYLLLQSRIEDTDLVFEFYGQKDGRVATVSEPEITNKIEPPVIKLIPTHDLEPFETKCTERARYGLTADVVYQVVYKNGRIREQNFHSVYVPWQEVCLVGVAR